MKEIGWPEGNNSMTQYKLKNNQDVDCKLGVIRWMNGTQCDGRTGRWKDW